MKFWNSLLQNWLNNQPTKNMGIELSLKISKRTRRIWKRISFDQLMRMSQFAATFTKHEILEQPVPKIHRVLL